MCLRGQVVRVIGKQQVAGDGDLVVHRQQPTSMQHVPCRCRADGRAVALHLGLGESVWAWESRLIGAPAGCHRTARPRGRTQPLAVGRNSASETSSPQVVSPLRGSCICSPTSTHSRLKMPLPCCHRVAVCHTMLQLM